MGQGIGLAFLRGDERYYKQRFDVRQPVSHLGVGHVRMDDIEAMALGAIELQWPVPWSEWNL